MPAVRRLPVLRSRRTRRPQRSPARTALLAVALAGVLVAASGCDAGGPRPEPSAAPPTPSATPLSAFDTSGLTVPRAAFCERVPPADAQRTLGSEVASSTSYGNGEPAPLGPGVRDIAHEFGCTWTAADGTRARAWVFTPPVTRARARELVAAAAGDGCVAVPAAPEFGAPGTAVRCRDRRRVQVTFSGLFGDAWLSCQLDVARREPTGGLVDRTGEWCVSVAQAASAAS